MWRWEKYLVGVALVFVATVASGREIEIDGDCQPRGFVSRIKERLNPKLFWTNQDVAVTEYWRGHLEQQELARIQKEQDDANLEFERRKMRALGFPTGIPDDLQELLQKGDRLITQLSNDNDSAARRWVEKCRQVIRTKLSKQQN